MPKLWSETIDAHRQEVREAILDTTVELVEERGLLSVTMSEIAEQTGIGRATLYKYFPDVESILQAWHEREITGHLEQLAVISEGPGTAAERLEKMLNAFGEIAISSHGHADTELASLLHRGHDRLRPERHLQAMLKEVLQEAANDGDVRTDMPAQELATYCLHAMTAARSLKSKPAVRRLVEVTLTGLFHGGR